MITHLILLICVLTNAQDNPAWQATKRNLDSVFKGPSQPSDRVQAVSDLGRVTTASVESKTVDALLRALDKELGQTSELKVSGDVLAAIVSVLSAIRTEEAVERLIKSAQSGGHWRKRTYVIQALSSIPGSRVTRALMDLVYVGKKKARENEPHLATAALDALAARKAKEALELMHRALADPNLPWEARLGALNGIARIAEKASIGKMIDALKSISNAQGRLKTSVIEALRKMTGLNVPSGDPEAWREALKNGKLSVEDDPGTRLEPIRPTEFFGLKTKSSRVVFVLDHSESMEEPASDLGDKPPEPPKIEEKIATGGKRGRLQAIDPIDSKRELNSAERQSYEEARKLYDTWRVYPVSTRLDLVKKEFIKSLFWIDHRVQFAVFFYGSKVTALTPTMLPATWANKVRVIREVEKITILGWTNIGDALFDNAMRMVGQRGRGGKYEGPPTIKTGGGKGHVETVGGPDTIYLLTDGEPNTGRFSPLPEPWTATSNAQIVEIQKQTKENITNELKKVHPLRKVTVHTICVGDVGAQKTNTHLVDPQWLKSLAEMTGGKSVHVTGK